jgi:hypothetical protein
MIVGPPPRGFTGPCWLHRKSTDKINLFEIDEVDETIVRYSVPGILTDFTMDIDDVLHHEEPKKPEKPT